MPGCVETEITLSTESDDFLNKKFVLNSKTKCVSVPEYGNFLKSNSLLKYDDFLIESVMQPKD